MKNSSLKYWCIPAYIKPKQYNELLNLKNQLCNEYGIYISLAELIRDSIDLFLEVSPDDDLKKYLEQKGW